jgi:hypothetical protein
MLVIYKKYTDNHGQQNIKYLLAFIFGVAPCFGNFRPSSVYECNTVKWV